MIIAFDLDDTLFPEIGYVHSAYRAIASRYGINLIPAMLTAETPAEAFDRVVAMIDGITIGNLLDIYRNHIPDIKLPWQSLYTLALLRNTGHTLALITDGRSVTQRHKIEALGLNRFIAPDSIIISQETGADKTTPVPFETVMKRCRDDIYIYVGDNPAKDFYHPANMGWHTVCLLDSGRNIHPQDLSLLPDSTMTIHSLTELPMIINATVRNQSS